MTTTFKADFHVEADSLAEFSAGLGQLKRQIPGALAAGDTGSTGGTGGPTLTGDSSPDPDLWSATKVATTFFPTDYGVAAFPSPEQSQILVDKDGTYHGEPYLKDAQGAVWRFDRDANGKLIPVTSATGAGFQASCNGAPILGPDGKPQGTVAMIISQGEIYFTAPGGFVQKTQGTDVPASGNANTSIPPFFQDPFYAYKQAHGIGTAGSAGGGTGGTGSGSTGGVPVPADPPKQSIAYGSTGKTLSFGPGQTYAKPSDAAAAAQPGDTIVFVGPAGTVFADSFKLPEAVKIDGGGRWPADMTPVYAAMKAKNPAAISALYTRGAVLDGATLADPTGYAGQMGGIAYMGNGNVVGFEIMHFGMQETQHGGTAALRAYGSCIGQIQGADNYIHDCQNGIGPGGTQIISGPWTRTVIHNCSLNDGAGGAHAVYDSSNAVHSLVGPDFYSDGGTIGGSAGHGYKSRAGASVTITAPFYIAGSDSSAIDIPQGTAAQNVIGAGEVEQYAPAAGDTGFTQHTLIGVGAESTINGQAGTTLNGTILSGNVASPNFLANCPVDASKAVIKTANPMGNSGGAAVTWPAGYAHA